MSVLNCNENNIPHVYVFGENSIFVESKTTTTTTTTTKRKIDSKINIRGQRKSVNMIYVNMWNPNEFLYDFNEDTWSSYRFRCLYLCNSMIEFRAKSKSVRCVRWSCYIHCSSGCIRCASKWKKCIDEKQQWRRQQRQLHHHTIIHFSRSKPEQRTKTNDIIWVCTVCWTVLF